MSPESTAQRRLGIVPRTAHGPDEERRKTIAVLREEAGRDGVKDTRLAKELLELAKKLEEQPDAAPRHAPVPIQAMLPTSAPAGLDRSLPVGDRDEDFDDAAVLALFEGEPGSNG